MLISGETGTEKELLARAIHQNSPRRHKPFVTINCGAVPKDLIEAELFGFKRGAFTGAVVAKAGRIETADGGTLFLDEIGELPLLRERKGGVPELIQHLFRVMKERHGLLLLTLDAAVTSRLCAYRWPGNVRELENVIERMIVLCSGNQITVNDLPDEMVSSPAKADTFLTDLPEAGSAWMQ